MSAQIGPMFLGALLVAVGVLTGAWADRIRGARRAARGTRATSPAAVALVEAAIERDDLGELGRDVVAALVEAGYKKDAATAAALACPGTTRATIESWTRAALKQCMQKASKS